MKRREFVQWGAGALLAAGLWPGRLQAVESTKTEAANEGSWRFIAVNDLHVVEAACRPWFDAVVAAMKRETPDAAFCLANGDLADSGLATQLTDACEAFAALSVPVYATPGNHDYAAGDNRSAYEKIYPGHINQSFEHRGWQFVGLDSSQGTRFENVEIQPATFEWLDTHLPQLDQKKPTVIFTHFPMGAGVKYRPLNADALLERFLDFNLQAVLSGHWHGASEKSWHNATLTTDRCCSRVRNNHDGSKQKGWFVCEVKAGRLSRRFVEIPAVPAGRALP